MTTHAWQTGLVLLAGLASPAAAEERPGTSADLWMSVARFQPGVPFHAGVRLRMPEGAHTYWMNPGDSGLATAIRWTLPEGFRAAEIRWPAPRRFVEGGLASYGFDGEVILPVEIRPPPDWPPGRVAVLRARVDWLECRGTCVPGRADVERRIEAAARAEPSGEAAAIARALDRVPRTDPAVRAEAAAAGGLLRLLLTGLGRRTPELFIPETGGIVRAAASPVWERRADGGFEALLPLEAGPTPPDRLSGVLLLKGADATGAVRLEFEVREGTVRKTQTPTRE